jgi:hypothetical protein
MGVEQSYHRALATAAAFTSCLIAGCRAGQLARVSSGPISRAEADARDAIRREQALRAQPLPERTVGISPFASNVRDTSLAPLGYGLADLLVFDLAASRRVTVVERIRFDAVVRELELGQSGRVDSATAPRVGRLVQARYLVLGTLSEMPNADLRIDTRVANVTTSDAGRPLAFSAPVARVLEAEKALAVRLLEELGVGVTSDVRAAIEQPATRSQAALLAYSRGVRDLVQRRIPQAVSEFETAARLDPSFRQAQTRLGEARTQQNGERGSSRQANSPRRSAGDLALEQVVSAMPLSIADRPGGAADAAFPTPRAIIIILVNSPR